MNDTDQIPGTPASGLDKAHPAPSVPITPQQGTKPNLISRSVKARMTVGPGIKVKGDVSDCDSLAVEGTVEATLVSEVLEVAEGGTYTGTATVTDAEIHGRFEGELTTAGVLKILSTGHVTGTIKYGRIEVEPGGKITGAISLNNISTVVSTPAERPQVLSSRNATAK